MAEPTSAADNQILKPHSNAIVPHKIANHDTEAVQLNVWNGTEWVNIYDGNDMRNMNIDLHKVSKVVEKHAAEIPAVESAANSAVEQAESAVSASKVNSEAIAAQSEAVSEAKSAISSATAAIQQTAATAASDAAKIRADVAQVQNEVNTAKAANSASVEALKSDVSATKQDIQAARQANENVAKQLDDYTKQAQDQGKTIKDIQDAQDGYTATLADVKGNVSKISDAVDGLSASLKDDQDNVATIKAKADELSATLNDHDENIAQLTASAKELSSTLEDADGRLSKVEQTASTLVSEFSDQQGHLNRVEQKATGTEQTVANQQGQINTIKTDAAGIHETLTGQGNQIANINVTLNGLNTKYEGVSGDLNKLKSQAQWATVTSAVDLNNVKTPCHEFLKGTVTNAPNETAWWYLTVEGSESGRITQTVIADQSNNRYTRRWADGWSAWVKDATQTDVTALSNRITTNSTQITQNKQAIVLKADQSTVNNLSGEVSQAQAQLKVQADQISSKVSSDDFKTLDSKVGGAIAKIDKNATAIDQTDKQISLKADQTEVDTIKGTATQNSSRLDTMANEIQSKVTSTDVNNIVDGKGYATANTVQSLIDQKAGTLNESITKLSNDTVTQLQQVTASVDGLQSSVANKADESQVTQLSNLVQSKVSSSDFNSKITQLANDINLRVTKGDLLSQINITAGNTLIQSGKIYFDAKSVVFGKDSEAFIPAALITNLTADQITTGTLKSIQIDNGDGKFTVNPNGDVIANSITLRKGKFMQGTIAGSTIYALNNDGVQDPKLAPKSDWYKITPNMIRWFNHYDQSVGQIGVGQGMLTEGPSEFTGTPGLTISDSAKILLGTAQRTVVNGDEIGNLETTGLDWMSKTNLEIKADGLQVNLDPDQGNEYDGKGAEFSVQKDNKVSFYVGGGDDGNAVGLTTAGNNNHIAFNTSNFDIDGEVNIKNDHGLTAKNIHVTGWLGVDGSKNSIVKTSQGTVAINAYETAEYYFGDIGEGQTGANGIAYIGIEKLFNETVNTSIPYQVFITAYGPGNIWVEQREQDRFVVKSDQSNIKFGWEIKAKRKGYENTRLQNVDNKLKHMEATS